jgi:predicted dehydrogenase
MEDAANRSEPLRAGVAGVGWWGGELVRGARASGAVEMVSCFSPTGANRTRFAAEHGLRAASSWDDLIGDDEIEAVFVATPHSTHLSLVEDATGARKHVFVDKPLTLSVDEGLQCVKAAEEAGVVLQVGHNRRRQGATRRIRRLIEEGALGTVVMADANMSGTTGLHGPTFGWRNDPEERPLSGMTPYGVHLVDSLHFLIGPISAVTAMRGSVLSETSLDDAAVLLLEFAGGPVGMLGTSTSVPTTNRIGVLGSAGTAWNYEDGARLLVQGVDDKAPAPQPVEQIDTVAEELTDFAISVRTGRPPEVGGREGLAVVGVLEAALESAVSGKTVEVRAEAVRG